MSKYKEFFELIAALLIAVFTIYFIPFPINNVAALIVLPIVWKSRRDYFWLAFFIILEDQPGGFFSGGNLTDTQRLPLYSFAPGFSFTIRELFYLLMVVKVLSNKKREKYKQNLFFSTQLQAVVFFYFFLIILSFFIGVSGENLKNLVRYTTNMLPIFFIFYIIRDLDDLSKFFRLVAPIVYVALFLQVFTLVFKQPLVAFLINIQVSNIQGYIDELGNGLSRPIELITIIYLTFVTSLLFLSISQKEFSTSFLSIVNILSFVSILITATRGWFLGFLTGYLLFFLMSLLANRGNIFKLGFVAVLFVVLSVNFPVITSQIESASERLGTVNLILGGDITAGGTSKRYDIRAPQVLENFYKSTVIFGAAFSDNYFKNNDSHVGYHNMLLNTGIVGAFVFFMFYLKLIIYPLASRNLNIVMSVSIIPLLILMVINFSSQTLGYMFYFPNSALLQIYAILIVSLVVNEYSVSAHTTKKQER